VKADPFDAARTRLQAAKRRRRPARPQAPKTIVPVAPAAGDEPLTPDRLDAARASLRARIPPREDDC
jgi:hypothetical protein